MTAALAILRRVPLLGWVCIALALLLGAQQLRLADARADVDREKAAASQVRTQFAIYRETQERQARQVLETMNRDAARTALKRQEAADAEHLARLAAQADADRLRRSDGQLRRYAADLATSLGDRARDTAAAGSCEAADARIVRLSLVVGALDEFAGRAVRAADEARRAGQLCERTYDALMPAE